MKKPFRFSFVFTLVMTSSLLGSMLPNQAFAETDESAPLVASPIDSCQAVAFGEQRQPKASAANVKLTVNYGATAERAPGADLTSLVVQAYRFNNTSWVGVYSRAFCTPLVTTGTSSSISCETTMNDEVRCDCPGTTAELPAGKLYRVLSGVIYRINAQGIYVSTSNGNNYYFWAYA